MTDPKPMHPLSLILADMVADMTRAQLQGKPVTPFEFEAHAKMDLFFQKERGETP